MPISPIPKGICYGNDVFPAPYDPSSANKTLLFSGSDNAAPHMAPLWGKSYKSSTGAYCDNNFSGMPACRDDIVRIRAMGVDVIRLYDWEPRNDHTGFLDACLQSSLKVLVSVSNYFLKSGGGFGKMDTLIPKLIKSFSKGADYHPAVVGIVIGNEFDGYDISNCAQFTNRWIDIERKDFAAHRQLPIGHPLTFGAENGQPPCWYKWDSLVPALKPTMKPRLFLAPQTYNPYKDLFVNFAGRGRGWVDLTYDRYQLPIWFTEIGQNRIVPDHVAIVKAQLKGCLDYSRANPSKLIGACFFSYADKVWVKSGQSEASFGAHSHARKGSCTITYTAKDFAYWDVPDIGELNVDVLSPTDLYDAVKSVYQT